MKIEIGDEVMLLEDWGSSKNKTWYGVVIKVDDITSIEVHIQEIIK